MNRAAFFDVDETLITTKSMVDFLRYWLDGDGRSYCLAMDAVLAAARRDPSRAAANRAYYLNFAGSRYAEVLAAGRDWYAAYRRGADSFVAAALAALAEHRAAGDTVVLVSGSFEACLRPLAEDLGSDLVLCSDPEVAADGTYTGEVATAMVGPAKAAAVTTVLEDARLSSADCFAYGDHASDLDMLRSVGHPVVVGDDLVLGSYARERGWPVLSAAGGPRRGVHER